MLLSPKYIIPNMRRSALLHYISVAFLATTTCAGPVGYNLRRHDYGSGHGQKVLITTEIVFTKTLTLEVDICDLMPCTSQDLIEPTQIPSLEAAMANITITSADTGIINLELTPSTTQNLYPLPTLTPSTDEGRYTTTSSPSPETTQSTNSQSINVYSVSSLPSPTLIETTTILSVGPTSSPTLENSMSPSLPLPTYNPQYKGAVFDKNVPLAIEHNKEFSNIKTGDKCDLEVQLLACEGTMGGSILQCGQGSTYESVLSCTHGAKCFATPLEMTSGVSVTCDTEEAAAAKFGMSVEELLQKIK